MNIKDIYRYGHLTVLRGVDGLPDDSWEVGGVCGRWAVKEIIAHLASYEHLFIDVLNSLLSDAPTPYLEKMIRQGAAFNDAEVEARAAQSPQEALQEYSETYTRAFGLLEKLPVKKARQVGALSWYGADYDLEDFTVYTFYGHKREHTAQIAVFRDSLS